MKAVRAHDGETVDAICYRVLGRTAGVTERVLALNPGLAELGPRLPQGTLVQMPEQLAPRTHATVQLWS